MEIAINVPIFQIIFYHSWTIFSMFFTLFIFVFYCVIF